MHFKIVLTAPVGIWLSLLLIGLRLLMALRFTNISVGEHFRAYRLNLLALLVGLLLLIRFPRITLFLRLRAGAVR